MATLQQEIHSQIRASAQQFITHPSPHRWITSLLVILWLLSMIAVPIGRWTIGESIIPPLASLTVVLQFLAVFSLAASGWGLARTVRVFLLITFITFIAEFMGSKTGFPFGSYAYSLSLQPQFAGVPVVIPLAWFMMILPSWAVALLIAQHRRLQAFRYIGFLVLSAGAITAWDLFLDPQMVSWGFWRWHQGSGEYFGIPWVNYAGWFLTGLVLTLAVPLSWIKQLPLRPLTGIYMIVWLLQTVGLGFFWGQPGPALVGFVVMGLFAFGAIVKSIPLVNLK
jgi:lycopene beta-cyclase